MNPRRQRARERKQAKETRIVGAKRKGAKVYDSPFDDPDTIFASGADFHQKACRDSRFSCGAHVPNRYKRRQLLVTAEYVQPDKVSWREWRKREVDYSKTKQRYDAGELEVFHRQHEGRIVTFFREKHAVQPGDATPTSLTQKSAASVAASGDSDQSEDLRTEEERVIMWPFVGPNPALTVYPVVGAREVKAYESLTASVDRRTMQEARAAETPKVRVFREKTQAAA